MNYTPMRPLRLLVTLVLLLALPGAAISDDRDLLRFNSSKPYLFVLLDTSGSMTQAPDGSWLPANGDDPQSKIYQAKEALYEVFRDAEGVHVGFATFNQDSLRVRAKHWLYSTEISSGSVLSLGGISYPEKDEILTLGRHMDLDTPGVAGSCEAPLSLETERERINRFPKLGVSGQATTTLWISSGGTTYRLVVGETSGQPLGSATLTLKMAVTEVADCANPPDTGAVSAAVGLRRVREFLMRDGEMEVDSSEPAGGFWEYEDARSAASCDDGGPFSGDGWEGNYDSLFDSGDATFNSSLTDDDRYCTVVRGDGDDDDAGGRVECRNLKQPTTPSAIARELDVGDMVPLNWDVDNVDLFLDRLAPNRADGVAPDFGAASYFVDVPDELGLPLKNSSRRPILATGADSPLGDAIADFRCWYLGQGANKCGSFGAPDGWENVALQNDAEWGCRRPYLIVVGDGGDSCPGENPCADTANLFSKASIRSWVITYGGSAEPPLSCIAQNGRGELVFVDDKASLVTELQRVLGIIREEASAFAAAAAPSTQKVVDQTVYVSSFVPLNGQARWDGHLDSFLKPLPLDTAGQPDRTREQFQWDAGEQLKLQAPALADALAGTLRVGLAEDRRRVFYAALDNGTSIAAPGSWPSTRVPFTWTDDDSPARLRYDLWRGLEVPFSEDDPSPPVGVSGVDQAAQDEANEVIARTLAIREHTLQDGTMISYVLGDNFHSDPLVIGGPSNVRLFAENAEGDGSECDAGNPGYRCFFRKHQFRRKQLVVGGNDGQLRVFDAGVAEPGADGEEARFNAGSGRETFSYIPRAVLPTIRALSSGVSHRFGVDSSPVAADVFIDPVYSVAPDADEREFRTVVITGLREGGSAYFALDLTQPDTIGNDGLPDPRSGALDYVPSCLATGDDLGALAPANCGPVPYPAPLWEYNDHVYDATNERYVRMDEDLNGVPDLGDTWAKVAIGRIQICEGADCVPGSPDNDLRDLWVAVFPGGMDPDNKFYDPRADVEEPPLRGDWLYMVDIETGQTVYKRKLTIAVDGATRSAGSAPGGAAAVDTDQDGYLDRVYVGTIGGYMFRVDLGGTSGGEAPALVNQVVASIDRDPVTGAPITYSVPRIPLVDEAGEPLWEPRVVFDANFEGGTATTLPRALYQEPTVIFVAELGYYALAFGSGDREDLWSSGDQPGRFYVLVDDTDLLEAGSLPLTEGSLVQILPGADDVGGNLLSGRDAGQRGWYLALDTDERVITEAFSLAGVTFFSSFQPDVEVAGDRDPLCSKTGGSRIFIVNTTNGNAFLVTAEGSRSRYMYVDQFVTQPYAEQGSVVDGGGDDGGGGGGDEPPPTADDLTDQLSQVMEEMKKLFPRECKFANYRIDIKTLSADTGVVFIAPVPVCLMEKNWREF